MSDTTWTPKQLRAAQVASALADAYRADKVHWADVLRIIRHELRGLNANSKLLIPMRSVAAQAVIDEYAAAGQPIPKNGSDKALHADHVWTVTVDDLNASSSVTQWLELLKARSEVVCVTARENYNLSALERAGIWGYEKYAEAGITLIAAPAR